MSSGGMAWNDLNSSIKKWDSSHPMWDVVPRLLEIAGITSEYRVLTDFTSDVEVTEVSNKPVPKRLLTVKARVVHFDDFSQPLAEVLDSGFSEEASNAYKEKVRLREEEGHARALLQKEAWSIEKALGLPHDFHVVYDCNYVNRAVSLKIHLRLVDTQILKEDVPIEDLASVLTEAFAKLKAMREKLPKLKYDSKPKPSPKPKPMLKKDFDTYRQEKFETALASLPPEKKEIAILVQEDSSLSGIEKRNLAMELGLSKIECFKLFGLK